MFKYKNINYFLEQAAQNSSDLKKSFDALNDFISTFNGLSEQDKIKMTETIPNKNEIYGTEFFEEAENILKELSNVNSYSPESQEFLKNNKEEIFKKINEFNDILKIYPTNYDNNFKSQFDSILGNEAYKTSPIEAPTVDSEPDKEKTDTSTEAETKTPTKPEKPKYATDYKGVSIVDFLDQSGQPSDFASRKELATKMGIPKYTGTASQNLLMLNALRGGQKEIAVKPAEFYKAAQTPPPQIKFGGSKQTAYIDMGGGRYAPASEDQLGDPDVQLYVKNPRKGQGEYLKPNYVKVRREGDELRRQSKFGGILGSLSNLGGDIGNTLAGKNREEREPSPRRRDREDRESSYEDYATADRPPAKKQSKDGGVYQRNPEGVDSFFKQ